jgi:hippurate hydrolase
MRALVLLLLATVSCFAADVRVEGHPGDDAAVVGWLNAHLPELTATYEALHAAPEISFEERETAAGVARDLGAAGYQVTSDVGKTGVVGVLANGTGRTVLIRGDLDALPIAEATGLPYASRRSGVMHACGHDAHTTALVGTARALAALRDRWHGTVVIVAQPAEEVGQGARAMIADGLFERFPHPDATLALHVAADLPEGTVGWTAGWWAANVDSVDVTIHGRGAHGARPQDGVDPIVAAAQIVTAWQTLVSRRIDPTEDGVVTVGSIHGGTKGNVIPDDVAMQLTVRSFTDDVRRQLLDGIRQIATDTCRAFGCPTPPTVVVKDEYTPAAWNDPALAAAAARLFRSVLGDDHVVERRREMIGEDFGVYARTLGVPGFLFRVGTVGAAAVAASRQPGAAPLPSLHSSTFAPIPGSTLRTAVRAMTNLVLALR